MTHEPHHIRRRWRAGDGVSGRTQGPWRLNAGDETKIMAGGLCIASVHCGGTTGIKLSEAESNARQIAETPALVEALQSLLALHIGHHNAIEHAHARKVIARATGAA